MMLLRLVNDNFLWPRETIISSTLRINLVRTWFDVAETFLRSTILECIFFLVIFVFSFKEVKLNTPTLRKEKCFLIEN